VRYVAHVHFCYLDESGGTESPDQGINSTPVMVIVGLIVEAGAVPGLTRDFLALKRQYFPRRFNTGLALDSVLHELKGNEVLQMVRSDSRNKRRQASLIQRGLIDLVNRHDARVVGRIWVKRRGKGLKPDATYCYAAQDIAKHFSQYLTERGSTGVLIADGRNPEANSRVAHSIFTQKYRVAGDPCFCRAFRAGLGPRVADASPLPDFTRRVGVSGGARPRAAAEIRQPGEASAGPRTLLR